MIKVISFDIGGTLIDLKDDFNKYGFEGMAKVTKKDVSLIKEAYKNVFQTKKGNINELVNDFCMYLNISVNDEIIKFFTNKFNNSSDGYVSEDKIMVIKKLKDMGYKIILLSNSCILFNDTLSNKIKSLVDDIFYSYDIGYTKKDNECYKIIEIKLGYKSNEFLHIGDTIISDYYKPIENGWNALYYGKCDDDNVKCIENLDEILNYIEDGEYYEKA